MENKTGVDLLNNSVKNFVKLINRNLKKSSKIIQTSEITQKELRAIRKESANHPLMKNSQPNESKKSVVSVGEEINNQINFFSESEMDLLNKLNDFLDKIQLIENFDFEVENENSMSELKNRISVYNNLWRKIDFNDVKSNKNKISELKIRRKDLESKLKSLKCKGRKNINNSTISEFDSNPMKIKIISDGMDKLKQFMKKFEENSFSEIESKILEFRYFIRKKMEYFNLLIYTIKSVFKITFSLVLEEFPVPEENPISEDKRLETINEILETLRAALNYCDELLYSYSWNEIDIIQNDCKKIKDLLEAHLKSTSVAESNCSMTRELDREEIEREYNSICYEIDFYLMNEEEAKFAIESISNDIKNLEKEESDRFGEIKFPGLPLNNGKLEFVENMLEKLEISLYHAISQSVSQLIKQDSEYATEVEINLNNLKLEIKNILDNSQIDYKVKFINDELVKLNEDAF